MKMLSIPKKRLGIPVAQVTDHVLIRWLERVEKVDLNPIREEMRRRKISDRWDRLVVQFIEDNSEFRFDEIERQIIQIIAIPALAGHCAVRHGDHVIRIVDGVAVSITPYHRDFPDTSRRKRASDLRRPRTIKRKWDRYGD